MKNITKAVSESVIPNGDDYPKQVVITVNRHPDDSDKILVNRAVTNLSGLELYGLLQIVTKAVEDQVAFPCSQRNDGIEVRRQKK